MSGDTYKYAKYVNSNQETRWATIDEIRNSSTYIDLNKSSYPVAGLPLLSDAEEAYVDGEDTHTLIFGSTGSKKTRLVCMPLINMMTRAGESFIVTDPKGELYDRTSGMAKKNGYRIVVLNFREIGKGDMWNPLAIPYELYHAGQENAAVAMLNDFVTTIAEPQFETSKDIFWPNMASSLALANLLLLMECAKPEQVNVSNLAYLCTMTPRDALGRLSEMIPETHIAGLNYRSVFTSAEETLRSIYVSLYGMIRIFNIQRDLTQMLSGNTVDIRSFGREKTAVYIIVPDEKTTYHFLVTTFLKQVYEILIAEAQKEKKRMLPIRVNFVLDEFCNIPKIPDMPSMISAARSRNVRYFLVVQSMHQLVSKYHDDADTIKGNCDNWVFLTSKELRLLEEISNLCGSMYTSEGQVRKLISVSELQRLDKAKGETLIMHARQYPIITELADIDSYEMFKGYAAVKMKSFRLPNPVFFSPDELLSRITSGDCYIPFTTDIYKPPSKPAHRLPFEAWWDDEDEDTKDEDEVTFDDLLDEDYTLSEDEDTIE